MRTALVGSMSGAGPGPSPPGAVSRVSLLKTRYAASSDIPRGVVVTHSFGPPRERGDGLHRGKTRSQRAHHRHAESLESVRASLPRRRVLELIVPVTRGELEAEFVLTRAQSLHLSWS
ncbi:hypothetical protein SKAU_G00372330 [Synaphobranchus kaupii]|uniref:Uncharacterized protein n=1 Tax=Synaphobranchus kaupii TaxID=118154 RepID=A0A9Q1IFX9_SYNKA|nr:hypothetical protein SKAU_G00372330 [Synaphobranchus kaupii]